MFDIFIEFLLPVSLTQPLSRWERENRG